MALGEAISALDNLIVSVEKDAREAVGSDAMPRILFDPDDPWASTRGTPPAGVYKERDPQTGYLLTRPFEAKCPMPGAFVKDSSYLDGMIKPVIKPANKGGATPAAAAAGSDGKKKGKDKGKGKDGGKTAEGKPEVAVSVSALDICVGRIVKVENHPNADALYLEHIDVGEAEPRQIVSGLRRFQTLEQMQDRPCVVVLNLKPAKMRDVMSYGMVLCASDEAHTTVEPLTPPEGAACGERITFEGFAGDPEKQINPKKKLLEKLFPDLVTNAEGTAMYKQAAFMTSKGPCTASLKNGLVR